VQLQKKKEVALQVARVRISCSSVQYNGILLHAQHGLVLLIWARRMAHGGGLGTGTAVFVAARHVHERKHGRTYRDGAPSSSRLHIHSETFPFLSFK